MIKEKFSKNRDVNKEKNFDFLASIKKHKLILLIVVVLLIGVGLFFIFKDNHNSILEKDENLIAMYDENKPIPVKKDGKFGYISPDGELLVDVKYDYTSEFYGDYASVGKLDGENTIYEIIDRDGNLILQVNGEAEPKYYRDCGIWLIDGRLYDKSMKIIFEGDYYLEYITNGYFTFLDNTKKESGIVNREGKKIFTWEQEYITVNVSKLEFIDEDLYAIVSNFEEEEHIVSLKTGKIIYTIEDIKNKYLKEENDNVFRLINRIDSYKSEKWLYFKDDKILYETTESIYQIEVANYKEDILKIDYGQDYEQKGFKNRYTYYNIKDDIYLKEEPNSSLTPEILNKNYEYEVTESDGKKGLNVRGEKILDNEYDEVKFLDFPLHQYLYENKNLELVLGEKDGKTHIFNIHKKRELQVFDAVSLESKEGTSFLIATGFDENGYSNKNYIVYSVLTNKSIEFDMASEIELYANYFTVTKGNEKSYYNTSLIEIYRENLM